MAVTADFEEIRQAISELGRDTAPPPTPEELGKRLDALVEAVEILAREHYVFPGLPQSTLRNALSRAKGW
jgi:hypothetical protein